MQKLLLLLLLAGAPSIASAEEMAPLKLMVHEAPGPELAQPTVVFSTGKTAMFGAAKATIGVTLKDGRPSFSPTSGHGLPGFRSAFRGVVPLGDLGALVFFTSYNQGSRTSRFSAKGKWEPLKRPRLLIPDGAAVIGRHAVLPQGSHTSVWYVFDSSSNEFHTVERPAKIPACEGALFVDGRAAVVAGKADGKRCAIAYEPEARKWRTLPAPPVDIGVALVAKLAKKTCLFGAATKPACWDGTRWKVLPDEISAPSGATVFTRGRGFGAWVIEPGRKGADARLRMWFWNGKSWRRWSERLPELIPAPVSAVASGNGTWLVAGTRAAQPVVVVATLKMNASAKELLANRRSFTP